MAPPIPINFDLPIPFLVPDCDPEPISVEDAAQSLVEQGWAPSHDEARADLEQARAQVQAEATSSLFT